MSDRADAPRPATGQAQLGTFDESKAAFAPDRLGAVVADAAPVGLFIAAGASTVFVNDGLVELTGRTRSELLTLGWIGALHADDRARVRAELTRAANDASELDLECRLDQPGGAPRWIRVRARAAPHEDGLLAGAVIDVTDAKTSDVGVREREAELRTLLEHSFDAITIIDADGAVRTTSASSGRISGHAPQSWIGNRTADEIHPDDRDEVSEAFRECAQTPGSTRRVQLRIRHADGHWVTIEAVVANHLDDPAVRGLVVAARDVTAQRDTEEALRASERRHRDQAHILEMIANSEQLEDILAEICRMIESPSDAELRCTIWLVDEEAQRLHPGAAPSFPASFVNALDGLPVKDGAAACGTAAARAETVVIRDALDDPLTASYVAVARDHDVRGYWSTPVFAATDGRVIGTFATYLREPRGPTPAEESAVESVLQLAAMAIERHAFENRLAHQAHHDPLTELPNRALFHELLEHALARAQRARTGLAVLFLDLDRFKVVNDSLGHDAGDALLAVLARRFESVLRPGDVVSRFGGDEFTILCEDLEPGTAARQANAVAERLIQAVREPVVLDGEDQFLGVSVGIALAFDGSERPEDLLSDADSAMYRAKERGRGRSEIFDETMRARAQHRREIENALHRAVSREELRVFYQPIISLHDGQCVGVEALLRWQHPERGLLAPRQFITLAEETGLIVPIGVWVLETACVQVAEWRRSQRNRGDFRLSVNLSGRQLQSAELASIVRNTLETVGLTPDALCVEITESILMDDADAGVGALKALKAIGARVSVDDFGTGYSSLGYLRRFPVDEVKIDQSFVAELGTDPADSAIVAAVVNLGHALGVSVVGEGVETEIQLAALRELGADAVQGFLFAPPQPAGDLTTRLMQGPRWI
jgi:diguanylate cyclase (GGDEF)-like protein/PAS domain S-box-containing protein